ncbi:hypothetical protein C0989_001385 [Termitomyces sp. Mn162]|nr:hypothetical protein C0989_001385 [Termitomyces sp. Mn162]
MEQPSVKIRIWVFATQICAPAIVTTISAANVMVDTEHKMLKNASQDSSKEDNKTEQLWASVHKVEKARFLGPKSIQPHGIKRPANSSYNDLHFCRGFIWDSKKDSSSSSPSALDTKTYPPLPSPPEHLLKDPSILSAVISLKGSIKVETPFNVNKFENMLWDHSNQSFVKICDERSS